MNVVATQQRTSPNLQPQAPIQTPQPTSAQTGAVSLPQTFPQRRFNWSYALVAIGVLSASGAGTAVLFKVFVGYFSNITYVLLLILFICLVKFACAFIFMLNLLNFSTISFKFVFFIMSHFTHSESGPS